MRDVQVGDVLECNRGRTQRVVRAVSRFNNGDLNCVVFTIMHCSWTGACTTTLTYTDLNYRGFRPHRCPATPAQKNRQADRS